MRALSHAFLIALAACFAGAGAGACESSNDGGAATPTPDPTPAPAGVTCRSGDVLVGTACAPVLPASTCKIGTRAALGSATCVAVGTTGCATGFSAHASGWGCVPIMPAAACKGATRESLGSTACVPVGDCNAAFPPAAATIFVDATFTDPQVDATHVKTLAAAIAAASAGATIAVAAGTYAESLSITKKVAIVGRCAGMVTLDAPTTSPAISTSGELTMSGITIHGGLLGIDVSPSTHVALSDVVLEQNYRSAINATQSATVDLTRTVIRGTRAASIADITNGIFIDVDAKVTLDESVVSGAADAGLGATGGSSITVHRSIVRDTVKRPDGVGGTGARVFEGASIAFDESAIASSIGSGVLVGMTKGSIKLVRSTILGTKPDQRFPDGFAVAASVTTTGSLDASDSTFADNSETAVAVDRADTKATLENCVVVGTLPGGAQGLASAGSASNGATLDVKSSAFIGNVGMALYALHANSTLSFDSSLIGGVAFSAGGSGLAAGHGGTAIAAVDAAHASITGSTIEGGHELALGALEAGTTMLVERTLVTGTKPNKGGLFGHALVGERKAAVTVRRSVFEKSSGIGIAMSGATGSVQGSYVSDNSVGIHVQGGSALATGAAAPNPVAPLTVFVTDDTQFDGNATRVGSGVVPLPDVISPTPAGS